MVGLELPPRYESLSPLGKGGGGEVWAVRDRITGRTVALKTLSESATEREAEALVREAVALSGLEGLGAPRVLRFGRLPGSGLPFLIRELVEGRSLLDLIEEGEHPTHCVEAIALAAAQLTILHRAGLLHGDVKPANIIVSPGGTATLVDLGLAAPWKEGGARPEGLTPRYAAPELLTGQPLSVRAEIFALGATLQHLTDRVGAALPEGMRRALGNVSARAMAEVPSDRFPSADELAAELRRVGHLPARDRLPGPDASWPIVGIDGVTHDLLERIDALDHGRVLLVEGARGAGRTALLRRAAWSLGIAGRAVGWIEAAATGDVAGALAIELSGLETDETVILIDDADRLDTAASDRLEDARQRGARIVLTALASAGGPSTCPQSPLPPPFSVPPFSMPNYAVVPHGGAPGAGIGGVTAGAGASAAGEPSASGGQASSVEDGAAGTSARAVQNSPPPATVLSTGKTAAGIEARPSDEVDGVTPAASSVEVEGPEINPPVAGRAVDVLARVSARFVVPPLPDADARDLLRRAIPSLSDSLVANMIARAEGRPGRLRLMVRRLEGQTVVAPSDLDRLLDGKREVTVNSVAGEPLIVRCMRLLDQGRFEEVAPLLKLLDRDRGLIASVARAKLLIGRGDAAGALRELSQVEPLADAEPQSTNARLWALHIARAHMRLGDYAKAEQLAERAMTGEPAPAIDTEALTVRGLAETYTGKVDLARATLERAVSLARSIPDRRLEGLALACLAFVLQRGDKLGEAKAALESALEAAEFSGDAGAVANIRLNLGVIARMQGDFAGALSHFEAAVDMGKRAGRQSTMQQALLNLANLDLYLGRYARARGSIERLVDQEAALAPAARAQLSGLQADLAARAGSTAEARQLYQACARAYDVLGQGVDAAEARLESVLWGARAPDPNTAELQAQFEQAAAQLKEAPAHRAMTWLARGAIAALVKDTEAARAAFDESLSAARAQGQKEWIWRALENRARLFAEQGDQAAVRRDIGEAVAVLEQIAAHLPRDLREVFWDDSRRRELRAKANVAQSGSPAAQTPKASGMVTTISAVDDRFTRILEINRELAAEHDQPRLLERITDQAIALLRAERGMVILAGQGGTLSVHASRDREGDDPHAHFSKNIAERVIRTGEAVVSQSVRDDEQMAGYVSVHQLMLQSVACVPIAAPRGQTIGALYLETRVRPGLHFRAELPMLRAFADQVAIAIENARLVTEAAQHARELEATNRELSAARARLDELLAQRTAQLDEARRDLRSTRAVLRSHFGYHGLVGTSAPMRKLYALIDRVKDTDVPVLISGESGTGKEVVARAIHQAGRRGKHPFTGLNCGAIPEHLLESELFGHIRGAFTGADRDHKGLFRESDGGTLLLDEIGEMPKKMQAGLLRVLQEKVVRPVGAAREISVDVRVIAATNRDLAAMVEANTFREDLYYRLHVVEVWLPPLRERIDDLPILIDHFFKIFAARFRTEKKAISREALRRLASCNWPGNVRQLENVLLSAWVMSDRPELSPDDFDLPALARSSLRGGARNSDIPAADGAGVVDRAGRGDANPLPAAAWDVPARIGAKDSWSPSPSSDSDSESPLDGLLGTAGGGSAAQQGAQGHSRAAKANSLPGERGAGNQKAPRSVRGDSTRDAASSAGGAGAGNAAAAAGPASRRGATGARGAPSSQHASTRGSASAHGPASVRGPVSTRGSASSHGPASVRGGPPSVRGGAASVRGGAASTRGPASVRAGATVRSPMSSRGTGGLSGAGPLSSGPASSRTAGRMPGLGGAIGVGAGALGPSGRDLAQHKQRERERILNALQSCNWNRVKAAQLVGMPRRTFYRRLKEYGIQ